jgi:hypothetical protein
MNHDDQRFEQRVRSALDHGVSELDAATRNRLAAIRVRASEQQPVLRRWLNTGHWLPTAALAASLILAVVIAIRPGSAPEPALLAEADIALDLLLDEEAQESDSDPDFYVWLDVVLAEEDSAHEG